MREESKSVLKCFAEISYQGEQSNDCSQLSDAPRWKLFLIFSPGWVVGLLCACQYIFVIFLSVFFGCNGPLLLHQNKRASAQKCKLESS